MVLSAWSADQTTVDINETRSKKFKAENAAAFFGFSFYLAAGKIRRLFWWLTLYRMVKQFMKNTYSDLLFWLKVALKEKWQGKLQKDILFIFLRARQSTCSQGSKGQDGLKNLRLGCKGQPVYPPDLAPLPYFLSQTLKRVWKEVEFHDSCIKTSDQWTNVILLLEELKELWNDLPNVSSF